MSTGLAVLLTTLATVGLALVALERGGAREVALVATLAAAAAAGRVLTAPIPGVQPVTVIAVATGATLGPWAGVAVGATAGLIGNSFLGHGPWTPAQMALWGLAGLLGAALRPLTRHVVGLVAVATVWGVIFGWGMNAWFLAVFGPELSVDALVISSGRSAPFDLAHAGGNLVIAAVAGPPLLRLLTRYAERVRVRVVIEPAEPPGRAPPPAPAPR